MSRDEDLVTALAAHLCDNQKHLVGESQDKWEQYASEWLESSGGPSSHMMEGVISVETLEGILYRETSIIAEEDVEALMMVIRTYATKPTKPKKRASEKASVWKERFFGVVADIHHENDEALAGWVKDFHKRRKCEQCDLASDE